MGNLTLQFGDAINITIFSAFSPYIGIFLPCGSHFYWHSHYRVLSVMKILIIFISGCEIFDGEPNRFHESTNWMKNER